ncbi:MAG: carbohydrate ABC transporter permease, partial [Syntrophomonadaceae bacterium]|nr:carbohydrate ABC transporter permease [Syntrophomonadaceae bacterium]
FGKAFLNTTIVSALSGIVVVILASSSAYILSFSFRQSKKLMFSLLISQMIPGITILIPLYLMLGNMGLRNTRLGLIIVYAGLMLPVSILILRNHFMTIPMEIIESAVLDGCTHFQVLSRIILPVVAPGLFATVFYVFLNVWNEFFFALILSESADVKMISVAISEFSTQGGIDYGMMSTAGVIGSVIPLILVILFQKHITEGLVSGWSK